jgi:hypothetical protein
MKIAKLTGLYLVVEIEWIGVNVPWYNENIFPVGAPAVFNTDFTTVTETRRQTSIKSAE